MGAAATAHHASGLRPADVRELPTRAAVASAYKLCGFRKRSGQDDEALRTGPDRST